MFRSYQDLYINNKRSIEIIDSDFRIIIHTEYQYVEEIIVKEYTARNLPVAKNIALLCMYFENFWQVKMPDVIYWQDQHCPHYVDNWAEIAAERDRYLDKLSAMK